MIHFGILEMNTRIAAPFFVFLTICVSCLSGRLINTFKIIRETWTLLQMSQKRTRQNESMWNTVENSIGQVQRVTRINFESHGLILVFSFLSSCGRTDCTVTWKSEGGHLGWGGDSRLERSQKRPRRLPLQCRNGKVCQSIVFLSPRSLRCFLFNCNLDFSLA